MPRTALLLALPPLAVLGGIPILAASRAEFLGMPALMAWIILWMPLTSLILGVCWLLHDRHLPDDPA